MFHEQAHHIWFGEPRSKPEGCRPDELRFEIVVAGRSSSGRPCLERHVRIGTVSEKGAHHSFVATHNCFVQRRETRLRCVWIGSFIEKEFNEVRKSGMSRKDRHTDTPGILIV